MMKTTPTIAIVLVLVGFTCADMLVLPVDFKAYTQSIPGSVLSIDMLPIEAGKFKMGSPAGEPGRKVDEDPQHDVELSAFWMSKYEITWEQYELFMAREIDSQDDGYVKGKEVSFDVDAVAAATAPYTDMSFGMGREGYPAVNITQYAAATFCKWLSAKTGLFYRLPTEAEWEYACRAGSSTAYHFGDDAGLLDDYAWHYANSDGQYRKVGMKKPNPWGLHDMHGNAAEWTLDGYSESGYEKYAGKTTKDPWSKTDKLYPRVVRGGSWYDDAAMLRSAARMASNRNWKIIDPQLPKSRWWHTSAPFLGFRIVRPALTPAKAKIEPYWLRVIEDN